MGMATAFVSSVFARVGMAGAVCIALTLSLQIGCGKPSNIPPVPALPPNDTPEGKLARVMQRLDSAIETAQAASGSGVISERRVYHQAIAPLSESDAPEAIVFIETKRALAPQTLNLAAQAKLQAEAEKRGEEPSDKPMKPLTVNDEEQIEVREFPLIYDGGRWKLVTELQPTAEDGSPSTEYLLFNYALDAN